MRALGEQQAEFFEQRIDAFVKRMKSEDWRPAGIDYTAERKSRLDAMTRALRLAEEAGK